MAQSSIKTHKRQTYQHKQEWERITQESQLDTKQDEGRNSALEGESTMYRRKNEDWHKKRGEKPTSGDRSDSYLRVERTASGSAASSWRQCCRQIAFAKTTGSTEPEEEESRAPEHLRTTIAVIFIGLPPFEKENNTAEIKRALNRFLRQIHKGPEIAPNQLPVQRLPNRLVRFIALGTFEAGSKGSLPACRAGRPDCEPPVHTLHVETVAAVWQKPEPFARFDLVQTDRALRAVDHDGQLPDRVRSPTEVYRARWVPRAGTAVEAADDEANDEVEHKRTDNEGEDNGDDQYDVGADAVFDGFDGVDGDSG
ncbi:hypothetical protein M5K25_022820 [Dendrobium thyrsiflorum]|uniref:Uncharacterized protein n=1 Tax=Dendrobium thyrsiflorum TaxID=117978 RepID=A0ABD0UDJ1_DENTH